MRKGDEVKEGAEQSRDTETLNGYQSHIGRSTQDRVRPDQKNEESHRKQLDAGACRENEKLLQAGCHEISGAGKDEAGKGYCPKLNRHAEHRGPCPNYSRSD